MRPVLLRLAGFTLLPLLALVLPFLLLPVVSRVSLHVEYRRRADGTSSAVEFE